VRPRESPGRHAVEKIHARQTEQGGDERNELVSVTAS